MPDNQKRINRILAAAAGIWFISLLAFLWYSSSGPKRIGAWEIMLYGVWNLLIFAAAYVGIAHTINQVMGKVDDSIQSLIDGRPNRHFSMGEETLLGKFQMQIMKLYQIMNSSKEHEKQMRKEMSELVGDLVHQVNTPLTNIQMYSQFLMQDDLTLPDRKQICEVIDSQVEKLGWFAEGFAKTARLEDDIMRLDQKKQPILEMVLRAIDQIALKAEHRGNEIVLEGNQNCEAIFDSRWTEEAVFNLLDNAVKYGEKGCPITITLTSYELFMRIDVKNWGEMIPNSDYNKIFTRFFRGEKAALVKDGVGLGLYLTRQIVMEQGGYVKVGRYGEIGNVFSILLRK